MVVGVLVEEKEVEDIGIVEVRGEKVDAATKVELVVLEVEVVEEAGGGEK